jgi:outer membrane protein
MFSRIGFKPLLACAALLAAVQIAPAQTKVGVINLQKAVFDSAEIKKADAKMQADFKPRQDQMDALQKEVAALAQQLQASSGKLSAQAEADLTAQGTRKQRDLQRLQEDLQADSTAYRNEVLQKSQDKMAAVIKKLAEEKGLDVVIEVNTTLYFKPALDLTADATAAYDKAYPAK